MNTMTGHALVRIATRTDLRALAGETSTCISIFLPTDRTTGANGTAAQHLKGALLTARNRLNELGLDAAAFVEALEDIAQSPNQLANAVAQSLAIYRSANRLSCFAVPELLSERVIISDCFDVLPLLKAAQSESEFYLLALSQKHTRLIHCTLETSEEVELPPSVPTNLFDFNQHAQPDHRMENRAQAGQKGKPHGSHPGVAVAFGTGSDADQKDEYLYHFYNEIDKQLQVFLRENPLPLVIAGVDYEIALYHRVSEYQALVPDGVHGSADGLKGGDLHARALKALDAYTAARIDKALAQYEKAGSDRISTAIPDVVKHAFDGRILHLFLAEGASQPGWFDPTSREVQQHDQDRAGGSDLMNLAALQTLTHAGDVFVLPPEKMPGQCKVTAMLRF